MGGLIASLHSLASWGPTGGAASMHSQKSWWHGIACQMHASYYSKYHTWSHTHIVKKQMYINFVSVLSVYDFMYDIGHQAYVAVLSPTSTVRIIDKPWRVARSARQFHGFWWTFPWALVEPSLKTLAQQESKEMNTIYPETMIHLKPWPLRIWWTLPWRTTLSESTLMLSGRVLFN